MVERILHVGLEFEFFPFGQRELFPQRKVDVPVARASYRRRVTGAAPDGAVGSSAHVYQFECGWIQILQVAEPAAVLVDGSFDVQKVWAAAGLGNTKSITDGGTR